jgi:Plant transposon protein.
VKLPLLVLGSLRCIASGCTFDAIEELTCVSQQTHRLFFHKYFCTWGKVAANDIIMMPHDVDAISHVTRQYEQRGLPGCVGSIDCVHVCWDRCPASMHSVCKGKDKVPTLAFQVVCSHAKRIMYVSDYFWGTYNDKTIARLDPLFDLFRDDDSPLKNLRWESNGCDNERKAHRGAYLICDGGYHEWACLVSPYKHQLPGTALEKWSKTVESVRKDVECVFGILKKRFLLLKHPIRLHDPEQIQRAFLTCCVLHNILIDYDLYDENDVEYGILEESAALRAANSANGVGVADVRSVRRQVYLRDDDEPEDVGLLVADASPLFHRRRDDLIEHLSMTSLPIYNSNNNN